VRVVNKELFWGVMPLFDWHVKKKAPTLWILPKTKDYVLTFPLSRILGKGYAIKCGVIGTAW